MKIYGQHDQATLDQLKTCVKYGAEKAVLCADGHLGYAVPIGGVLAHKDGIFLENLGYDIGCGNLAVKTDADGPTIKKHINHIMDKIFNEIEFGVGRKNRFDNDHKLFDDKAWNLPAIKNLKDLAREQLGTVGSGNHYVDIFEDEEGFIWVGLHFGSRGLGHKTATHFMKETGAKDNMNSPPTLVLHNSNLGADYLECARLAGEYAYAGREWVVDYILKSILGVTSVEQIHNHHNYVWRETHNGVAYWVGRKGATPAFPGQKGFIGGSMGDNAVIVEGVDCQESKDALYSTVHGAGRVMSRTQAKKTINPEEVKTWLEKTGVVVRGGDLDEAPQSYRRLPEVLNYHKNTIKILHTLRPLGVAMAGKWVKDPYKD